MSIKDLVFRRAAKLVSHILPSQRQPVSVRAEAAEDEPDLYLRDAEERRREETYLNAGTLKETTSKDSKPQKFFPHLIVPTYVEDSVKSGEEVLARRRKRVAITYDVNSARARTPENLDVTQDDAATPLAFRLIRIILLTAEARRAQDIHLDQYSGRAMSVVFTTQLGMTQPLFIRGSVVQAIISYLAHYEQITQGKPMPGPVHDYKIAIKVRPADFLKGTHNVYRVNCIRTNHELGLYHIVMRVLQN
uniref:General secretion pathway protein EL2 n=1 Tax=Malawimonas jakobiformis TaxID=136089 RepID=A0A895KQU6_MALJA|nr:general secretion pathway protein EL2 [Malawimonas jakobiformis]